MRTENENKNEGLTHLSVDTAGAQRGQAFVIVVIFSYQMSSSFTHCQSLADFVRRTIWM
jgi:hypothetical protein